MEITNYTERGNQTETFKELRCSTFLTEGMHVHLIYLSAINILLSLTAFLGNTLILVALRKESSLHPPSKLLLRCLATTDLCVSLISEPLGVIRWISMINEDWNLCRYSFASYFITGYILSSVSLLTLTAISVDRLLALALGLRYRQVVTLKRTYMIVVTFWVVSTVAATSHLSNHLITYWFGNIIILLCLLTSIICYTKIFLTLRRHQTQVQVHVELQAPSETISLNIARYRKAVSSALWLQLTLVVCYLPYGIMAALVTRGVLSSSNLFALEFAVTLAYLNSSLNPFLYCWKIGEVRQAVKETMKQVLCSSSS
ncbi:melanocyte-stimulating hormone receptor-like [Oculina patagonica]